MTDPTYTPVSASQAVSRKRWARRHPIWTAAIAALGVFLALCAAFGASTSPKHPAATKLKAVATQPAPVRKVPAQAAAPAPAPAQPQAPQVIARFSGTGTQNTGPFTTPASWHLSYAYTNGASFTGQSENFSVSTYDTDGTMSLNGPTVNALGVGTGQPAATNAYGNAGTHYLSVNTEDANWTIVVLSGNTSDTGSASAPATTAAPAAATAPAPAPASAPDTTANGTAHSAATYVSDIAAAGIVAPADWVQSTGNNLCTAWNAGQTTAQTDPTLLAGGVSQAHLSLFDSITVQDLCPTTTGGPNAA